MTKKIFLITLFIFSFLERVFFDLGPNTELVTVAMIASAAYLGGRQSFWLTFALIAITDLFIGNSNIFIFTWSGFLIPALAVGEVFSSFKVRGVKKIGVGTFSGIGANLFFYFWTNFGVWLMGTMYPRTASGLATSYINALPFLKMQIVSTLFFVPLAFSVFEFILSQRKSHNLGEFAVNRV